MLRAGRFIIKSCALPGFQALCLLLKRLEVLLLLQGLQLPLILLLRNLNLTVKALSRQSPLAQEYQRAQGAAGSPSIATQGAQNSTVVWESRKPACSWRICATSCVVCCVCASRRGSQPCRNCSSRSCSASLCVFEAISRLAAYETHPTLTAKQLADFVQAQVPGALLPWLEPAGGHALPGLSCGSAPPPARV